MAKRNLTLAEKKAVKATIPGLNVENWLIKKKFPTHFILIHKLTRTEKRVEVRGRV